MNESESWSETIRRGILATLTIKSACYDDSETQYVFYMLIRSIFDSLKCEKDWCFISRFWKEICEISPKAVLERIEQEFIKNTGLFSLFQNQSSNHYWGRSSYIDILWGIEQYLVQEDYFWDAFRWLLKLDSLQITYKSNSPKDILLKIFCPWSNFSLLETADDKIKAANIALQIDYNNVWNYLYFSIERTKRIILGEISAPKYRECLNFRSTTIFEMQKTETAYFNLLLDHTDCSSMRWKGVLKLSLYVPKELRNIVVEQLLNELCQMNDYDIMLIKNEIRKLVFHHRYFSSSDWAVSEDIIIEYERILDKITLNIPEYDYFYLFTDTYDFPLINPVPYDKDGNDDKNEKTREYLIKEKLIEFQNSAYNLTILASLCAKQQYSSLGTYIAKYWNEGEWDYSIFKCLLTVQESGALAIEYLYNYKNKDSQFYENIITELTNNKGTINVIAKIYRIEASSAKEIPLVSNASEQVKTEFWKSPIHCEEQNELWVLDESKKYTSIDVYLRQMSMIHYRKPLTAERIYRCFDNIEKMQQSDSNELTGFYIKKFITILQDSFIDDVEKSIRLSQLEIIFMNSLEWDDMKCYKRMIKQSPELFSELMKLIFKKDHEEKNGYSLNQSSFHDMYDIYMKAHFCPAELDGKVDELELENWIEIYRKLLRTNDQESLFNTSLGRLFSFSPIGEDGHEPCISVRKMIEKYGDENLTRSYQIAVFNRRGVYTPSAGKEEFEMAMAFKENALYLAPDYPKTSEIYYNLFRSYKMESERARLEAENTR